MNIRLMTGLALFGLLPLSAHATDQYCDAQCEEQYGFCADGALQAIEEGVFSGSGCSAYDTCDVVVQMCEAERTTCEAECG